MCRFKQGWVRLLVAMVILLPVLANTVQRAEASPYYWLYEYPSSGNQVLCAARHPGDPLSTLPFYAYFAYAIHIQAPAGAKVETIEWVNGVVTSFTTSVLSSPISGVTYMDRINTDTPYYTAEKMVSLYVGGILVSRTAIKATCTKEHLISPAFGPYGEITLAERY
jgi:hypothetical protein